MSVSTNSFGKTIKKVTAWSLAALTAMTCTATIPTVGLKADAAGVTLSDSARGVLYANSRDDFRDESIYFLITTRFYDGDTTNNFRCVSDAEARNPESDPSWRGDFKGLIDKLDYIKALGFTAIWITPVVQNNSNYDYHGYHASNFNAVDYRYESNGVTYQTLIDACHAKGIKIIQDVVFNHTCRNGEEGLNKLGGEVMANQLSLPWPQMNEVIMSNGAQYDPNNIYHHNTFAGSGDYDNYNAQIMTIADDCFDLETENPVVANYLVDAYKKYIDMGVDAFRVDTARHISRITMNAGILPHLQAEAEKVGNSDFYMFGEVCTRGHDVWYRGVPAISTCFYTWDDSDSEKAKWSNTDLATNEALAEACYNNNTSADNQPTSDNAFLKGNEYHQPDYSKRSNMGVIDFQMHWSFENANNAFGTALGEDRFFNDSTWNVVYVNSHDYSPDFCSDKVYTGDTESWAENLSLMFSFRGIPCVYYGTEIEFQKGCPIDKGPKAMLSETGRAYYGDNIEGSIQTSGFTVYNASGAAKTTLEKPLSQHLMRLNRLRQAIPALRKGQYSTEGCSGGLSFKRRYTDSNVDSFACVAISGSATFSGIPDGTYVDAVTGDTKTVSGGTLTANVSGKGNMKVYVLSTSKTPAPGRVIPNGTFLNDGGSAEIIGGDDIVVVDVDSVSVSPKTVTVKQAETATVTATVSPSNATDKSVTWTSSNPSVATVSGGIIKGVSPGTATITCTSNSNSARKATVSVTVTKNENIVDPTGISIAPSSLTLSSGETGTLTATVTPSNATDKSVTWSSSNDKVATVNNGSVKAVGVGTATITATTSNGKKATATITVEGKSVTYIDHGVYFEKPSGWGNSLNAYIYDPANGNAANAQWPGQAMTDDGNGVYYLKMSAAASSTALVIFNDGSNQIPASQQPGFDYKDRGYYTSNGFDHIVEKQESVEVTSVTVSPTSASVKVGSSTTLTASVAPSNATNKTITWSSSNTAVATVANGVVTGVAKGSATITATSNNGKTATATITVTDTPVDDLTCTAKLSATTISAGGTATVKCSATGGKTPYKYSVSYKLSTASSYTSVQSYSTNASVALPELTTEGSYKVLVRVKDANNTVAEKTLTLTVINSGDLTNLSTISATTIYRGETLTVTGKASGGSTPYKYAVYYKKTSDSSYTTAQDFSTTTKITVKPAKATTYSVVVKVKDSTAAISRKEFKVTVKEPDILTNTSSISATTINLGDTVKVTASAAGGKSPYQYAVYYKKDSDTKYVTVQDYSTTKTVSVKPQAATKYNILVKVKDAEGTHVDKSFNVTVKAGLVNNSTISAVSVQPGSSLTITGKATGGAGSYNYAYFYKKDGESSYTTIKGYSTTTTASVKPTSTGKYHVVVKVKDKAGTIARKEMTFNCVNGVTNTTKLSATSINLGDTIKITTTGSNGTSPYTYAFYYKKSSDSKFVTVRNFSSTNTATIKPQAATKYVIVTKVKDKTGAIARKELTATVTKPLTNTTALSSTSIALGETIKITTKGSGGTSPYTYAFYYKKASDSKYVTVKGFSTTTSVSIKPQAATTYNIVTKVKDKTGAIARKEFKATVKSALTNTTTLSSKSITLGETIKITTKGTGGTSPYTYAFYYKKSSDSKYVTVKDFSTTNTVTIKPQAATKYTIVTKVKDKTGTIARKEFTATVSGSADLSNASTCPTSVILGDSFYVTCKATGGKSPYQFAVLYKKSSETSYKTAQSYSTNAKVKITPTEATTYNVMAKVKDSDGTIKSKTFSVKVTM